VGGVIRIRNRRDDTTYLITRRIAAMPTHIARLSAFCFIPCAVIQELQFLHQYQTLYSAGVGGSMSLRTCLVSA